MTPLFQEGSRDNDLFHVANTLAKGGMNKGRAEQVLRMLANQCNPPFPQGEIKAKIESAFARLGKRELGLREEVLAFISVTNGNFSVTECNKALQTETSVTNRNSVRVILHRLWKEGVLQKEGTRDGIYRKVSTELDPIDFRKAKVDVVPIKWPFQIEKMVRLMKKNIVVVAGVSNAGKTALLLNLVKMNMGKFRIAYFSSEMGDTELRDRLLKFEDIPIDDWTFEPFFDAGISRM